MSAKISLDQLITKFVKSKYREATRLILVDYMNCPNYLARVHKDTVSCKPLLCMVDDNPHTMEYIDWYKVYKEDAGTLLLQLHSGFGHYTFPEEMEYLQLFEEHVKKHHPIMYYFLCSMPVRSYTK